MSADLRCPGEWRRGNLSVQGKHLVTDLGLTVYLNGINVSGSSKLCKSNGVGRPFIINEAHTHARRLVACGFNVIRLLVPWEAVEPEKDVYDDEYLCYLDSLIGIFKEYDLAVIIDPHQDVWSRFTGGSGAPYWTLVAAGFNPKKFRKTLSALVHTSLAGASENERGAGPSDAEISGAVPICWSTNHDMLACATMFTLFFGGKIFAPLRMVEGINIQDYLQNHFLGAMAAVFSKVAHHNNILGADTMNEPGAGFLGRSNLDKWQSLGGGTFGHGIKLTPFQSMCIGNGAGGTHVTSRWHAGPLSIGKKISNVNSTLERCWQDGVQCVWEQHGVYTSHLQADKCVLLKPSYFTSDPETGNPINIQNQCVLPFWTAFASMTRDILGSHTLVFRSPFVFASGRAPSAHNDKLFEPWSKYDVHSPHYYEPLSVIGGPYLSWVTVRGLNPGPSTKTAPPFINFGNNEKAIQTELEWIAGSGQGPMFIGETGISMRTRSLIPWLFKYTPDWKSGSWDESSRQRCLERLMRSIESSGDVCGHALWCYTPESEGPTSYDGDGWNRECFSLFSGVFDPESTFDGGQALGSAIRPYPVRTPATIIESSFDAIDVTRPYNLRVSHEGMTQACTEVFFPSYHYDTGEVVVSVSKGYTVKHVLNQSLLWFHPPGIACLNIRVSSCLTTNSRLKRLIEWLYKQVCISGQWWWHG